MGHCSRWRVESIHGGVVQTDLAIAELGEREELLEARFGGPGRLEMAPCGGEYECFAAD
jgi:hypothetical protein